MDPPQENIFPGSHAWNAIYTQFLPSSPPDRRLFREVQKAKRASENFFLNNIRKRCNSLRIALAALEREISSNLRKQACFQKKIENRKKVVGFGPFIFFWPVESRGRTLTITFGFSIFRRWLWVGGPRQKIFSPASKWKKYTRKRYVTKKFPMKTRNMKMLFRR